MTRPRGSVISAFVAVMLVLPARVTAQCPDGTPQPCRTAPAIDSKLIALLPFRTSGADARLVHLRDGFPELVAHQFTSDIGPFAVEPGEAFREWSRAKAGAEPATQAVAVRVARSLGAGQVLFGSVIGNSNQLTIHMTLLSTSDGKARGTPFQVQGPLDSLGVLVASTYAQLLGRSGADVGGTGTEVRNPAALHAFMLGRASYRRGGLSVSPFLRALAADSTYAEPAYWLSVLRAMDVGVPDADRADRLAWAGRHRLRPEQRRLLEAILGPNGPDNQSGRRAQIEALVRISRAPNATPETWRVLGESYLHYGALAGIDSTNHRATVAFERAHALDSTALAGHHLAVLAFLRRDRPGLVRWAARASSADGPRVNTYFAYMEALLSASAARIATARLRFARDTSGGAFGLGALIPLNEIEAILPLLDTSSQGGRNFYYRTAYVTGMNAGRPDRAARLPSRGPPGPQHDLQPLVFAESDSAQAERVLTTLLASARPQDQWRYRCEGVLSRLRRADTADAAATSTLLQRESHSEPRVCATLIDAIAASLRSGGGITELQRADSVLLHKQWWAPGGLMNPHWNHDLAIAYARHEEWKLAAAATKRRFFARDLRLAVIRRDEGRWSLLAGDTANAIDAFRHFLSFRANPEPAFVPQRDSIRALLAAIEKPRLARP